MSHRSRAHWWREHPARRLPLTLAPVPDECVISYLRRLAAANRLDENAFCSWLSHSRAHGPVAPSMLAVVTGYPERTLRQAMPELCPPGEQADLHLAGRPRPGDLVGPGCIRCNAVRGAFIPVLIWRTHDAVLCARHRCWITAPNPARPQPDLRAQPAVLRAHIAHRRLIRRYCRAPVHAAFRHAQRICTGGTKSGMPTTTRPAGA